MPVCLLITFLWLNTHMVVQIIFNSNPKDISHHDYLAKNQTSASAATNLILVVATPPSKSFHNEYLQAVGRETRKKIAKEKVVNTLLGVSEIPASITEVVNTRNMVMLQR